MCAAFYRRFGRYTLEINFIWPNRTLVTRISTFVTL